MADPDHPSITVPAGKIYLTAPGHGEAYIGQTDGADIAREPKVEERWAGVGPQLRLADAVPVSAETIITVRCQESRDNTLALGLMAEVDTSTPGVTKIVPRTDLSAGAVVALRHAADPTVGRARSLHVAKALVLPNGPVRLKRTAAGGEVQVVDLRFRVLWTGSSAPDWWFEEPDGSIVGARAGAPWPDVGPVAADPAGADWPAIAPATPDLGGAAWSATVSPTTPDLSGAAWSATVSPVAALDGAAWLAAPVPAPHDPRAWCGCPGVAEWSGGGSVEPPPPPPGTLSIGGSASHDEGDTGATDYVYTVTRTVSTSGAASVDWAVAGSGIHPADAADFVGGAFPSGTLDFADGAATATITVQVRGDLDIEYDEAFAVTLSNPVNAAIGTAAAAGAIFNDDAETGPNLLIATDGGLSITGDFGAAYTHIAYPAGVNPPFVSMASDRAGKILAAFNAADGLDMGFAWSVDYGQTWTVLGNVPAIGAADAAHVRCGDEREAVYGTARRWVIFTNGDPAIIHETTDPTGAWTTHTGTIADAPVIDLAWDRRGRWHALTDGPTAPLQATDIGYGYYFDLWFPVAAPTSGGTNALPLSEYGVGSGGRALCAADGGVMAVMQPSRSVARDRGVVIDDFAGAGGSQEIALDLDATGTQYSLITTDGDETLTVDPGHVYFQVAASGAIGGYRDLGILSNDIAPMSQHTNGCGFDPIARHGLWSGNATDGQPVAIWWNGANGHGGPFDGLGSVDLTVDGSTGIRIAFAASLGYPAYPAGAIVTLTVWSNGGADSAAVTHTFPTDPPSDAASLSFFAFAEFAGVGFADVSAISLTISAPPGFQSQPGGPGGYQYFINHVAAVDGVTVGAADIAVAEPFGGAAGFGLDYSPHSDPTASRTAVIADGTLTIELLELADSGFGDAATIRAPISGSLRADIYQPGAYCRIRYRHDFSPAQDWTVGGASALAFDLQMPDPGTNLPPGTAQLTVAVNGHGYGIPGPTAADLTPARMVLPYYRFGAMNSTDFTAVHSLEITWDATGWTDAPWFEMSAIRAIQANGDHCAVLTTSSNHWMIDGAFVDGLLAGDPEWAPMALVAGRDLGIVGHFVGVPSAERPDLPQKTYAVAGVLDGDRFGRDWTVVDPASPAADHREAVQPVGGDFVMISGGVPYRLNGGPWTAMPDPGTGGGDAARSLVAIR